MVDPSGPHLTAALICDRVLTEQDGVTSAIRIIDRIFLIADEDGNPIDPRYQFTLFVMFKSGAARGTHEIAIEMEKPSTERVEMLKAPVLFEGEERGVNIVFQVAFEPDQQGLYWFDVLFASDRVTRIPLRVIYQTLPTTGHGG
jgi:hypothetical protein